MCLRGYWPEGIVGRQRCEQARGAWRDGPHDRGVSVCGGLSGDAVHRALCGVCNGRVFPRPRRRRAYHLRRSDEAGLGLSSGESVAATPAGP